MKLLVATDAHIFRTPDGKHWCKSIYGYSFWERYLGVFEKVRIVARVKDVDELEGKKLLVDGNNVEIYGIPFYQGPKQLLFKYHSISNRLKNVSDGCDAAIFRMPSQTAYMAYRSINKKIPIGGEIVYDPFDDLNKKQSIISFILNNLISRRLYKFCQVANGVSYVTEKTIQSHYPSKAAINHKNTNEYFETFYSSITLDEDAFTGSRDYKDKHSFCIALTSVAMNSDRKGEKILIKTIQNVRKRGYEVSAVLIGDGTKRKEFENYADELGVGAYIKFTGMLSSSKEVRQWLLNSDLFMFPTQAEGLPRGILEAMAVGMPVLSTPVGGIPEVIESDLLFSPDDIEGFTNMVCELIDNPEEMNRISKINFEKSQMFSNELLQEKRDDFYSKLKDLARR